MKGDEKKESINHPTHYGGQQNPYEAIKIIEALDLGFCLGNTLKYISRAGKKDQANEIEDLKKARWYLDRQIQNLEHKALGKEIIKSTRKVTSKK